MAPQLYQAEVNKAPGTASRYASLLWGVIVLYCLLFLIRNPLAFVLYLAATTISIVLLAQVRSSLRQRFRIPAGSFDACEDACCASCSARAASMIQMLHQLGVQPASQYTLCHPTAGIPTLGGMQDV